MKNRVLLNEISAESEDRIKYAINNVLRVRITYNDRKPHVISARKGRNTRYILPIAFGLTKSGKKAVRAFQTSGSTKRGVPKWKLFLLDNIISWNNGKRSFKEYKDELIRLGLNTSGDKGMTTLFAITPFADGSVAVKKNSDDISFEPVTKNDIEPTTDSQGTYTTQQTQSLPSVDKMIPSKDIDKTSIDKSTENSYFKNKVESPLTEPIKKSDLEKGESDNVEDTTNDIPMDAPETKPIAKSEIEGDGVENPDADNNSNDIENIKNNFNDMMTRMNNIYNE